MKVKYIQVKTRRQLYTLVICLIALFLLRPPQIEAATPAETYISNGEDFLYSETVDGILQAHSIFQDAIAEHPTDAVINAYLALTRLLHLALTSDPGGLQELLTMYGIVRTGTDLDTLDYHLPEDGNDKYNVPVTAPETETARAFMSGVLLNAIDESIANLDIAITNWTITTGTGKHIVAKEKRGTDMDIEVEDGDIYLFRSGLKGIKALILTITAYDLNVDIREIAALFNLEAFSEKNFLDRYVDFLYLIPTIATPTGDGEGQLVLARTTLIDAIDDYITASDSIRSDDSLAEGADELIEINDCDKISELWFRDSLTSIKTTLSDPPNPASEIPDQEEEWIFTDGNPPSGDSIRVFLKHNKSQGKFEGIEGGDFVGYDGEITCLTIDGNDIYIEMESDGYPYSEVSFTGTLTSETLIEGLYSGDSVLGPVSGSFSATRVSFLANIERIDLNPLFGNGSGPHDVRDFLPDFNPCDEMKPGTVGFGFVPPDPTLGGILPDYTQDDWGLDPETCSQTGTSVTGDLSVPSHDGTGLIYIQLFYYYGQYDTDPDNRLGFQVIYADDFIEGMTYSLDYLPVGVQVFATAWWDVDLNGILSAGDYYKRFPVFTTESGQTDLDLTLDKRFGPTKGLPWINLLLLGD